MTITNTRKFAVGISSLVLVGTFAFGIASAADNGSSTTVTAAPATTVVADHKIPKLPKLTAAEKCAKQDEIAARVATAKQRIADRKAKLEARRVTAVANGNTQAVTRIDQRLARLQKISDRIDARYARYQKWVAANCSTTK
jgi:hypothetical protein